MQIRLSGVQVDHMTKLMLKGDRDESEDKENRKGNRRETWAPGLAGAQLAYSVFPLIQAVTCLYIVQLSLMFCSHAQTL